MSTSFLKEYLLSQLCRLGIDLPCKKQEEEKPVVVRQTLDEAGYCEHIPTDDIPVALIPGMLRLDKRSWLNALSIEATLSPEVEDGDLVYPVSTNASSEFISNIAALRDAVWKPVNAVANTASTSEDSPRIWGIAYRHIGRVMFGPVVFHRRFSFKTGDLLYVGEDGAITTENIGMVLGICLAPGSIFIDLSVTSSKLALDALQERVDQLEKNKETTDSSLSDIVEEMERLEDLINGKLTTSSDLSRNPVKAEGSETARPLKDRFGDVVNVKDFGAKGDGSTDDTIAFESAVNAAGPNGLVFVPRGSYNLSYSVAGNFVSLGAVETNQSISIVSVDKIKTAYFKDRLELTSLLTIPVQLTDTNPMGLQGFCSDGESYIWAGFNYNNQNQRIIRYEIATGIKVAKDYTNLYHCNSMTYYNGFLYVTPMATDSSAIVEIDAQSLNVTRSFTPEGLPATNAYAISFDPIYRKFYLLCSGQVWEYSVTWQLLNYYDLVLPSWVSPIGQGLLAYNGMLFIPRSGSGRPNVRYETIVVLNATNGKLIWHWFIPGNEQEIEDISIYKGRLLLGFNNGLFKGNEHFFYACIFDLSMPNSIKLPEDSSMLLDHAPTNVVQEISYLYVDATAIAPGDGTVDKPLNSIRRALEFAAKTKKSYRTMIWVAGDFSENYQIYIQGFSRLLQIYQWEGKEQAILPNLFVCDSNVRFNNIVFSAPIASWSSNIQALMCENSEITLRDCTFVSDATNTPWAYVNMLRGNLIIDGDLDFSNCAAIPSRCVIYQNSGSIYIQYGKSSMKFPDSFSDTKKIVCYGPIDIATADMAGNIDAQAYVAGKTASIRTGDGLGSITVNNPSN